MRAAGARQRDLAPRGADGAALGGAVVIRANAMGAARALQGDVTTGGDVVGPVVGVEVDRCTR